MAKSIAGVAMLCGILALVVLMARDVRTSNASHHDNSVALRAETTELRSTAPGASPVSSEMPDEQQRLDPKEIYNYQLNVHG
jgi:Tfp pilus assembly protein PilV